MKNIDFNIKKILFLTWNAPCYIRWIEINSNRALHCSCEWYFRNKHGFYVKNQSFCHYADRIVLYILNRFIYKFEILPDNLVFIINNDWKIWAKWVELFWRYATSLNLSIGYTPLINFTIYYHMTHKFTENKKYYLLKNKLVSEIHWHLLVLEAISET